MYDWIGGSLCIYIVIVWTNCTVANNNCFFHSNDIIGVHTDKTYKYKIGICVEPDPDSKAKCGIVQYEIYANGSTGQARCVGKITNSQVTESKYVVDVVQINPFY